MKHLPALAIVLLSALPAAAQDQQVGARTKAMGGSYTAFEDDPVSVWLNPAGIATQPDGMAITYQTYTIYELEVGEGGPPTGAPAEFAWSDPAIIPSYLGFTFQVGTPEQPEAVGFCFAAPFRMRFMYGPGPNDPNTEFVLIAQDFYRLRGCYSRDFRLKPEGFLTHVSVGAALDASFSKSTYTDFRRFQDFSGNNVQATFTVPDIRDMGLGGGFGVLVGLYDNAADFKVNLGLAWQSRTVYRFSVESDNAPFFDWPNQFQAGLTFYLMKGLPLRVTLDTQAILWNQASRDSSRAGYDDFQDVVNSSMGLEYRVKTAKGYVFYPRAGIRLYDAPWDDADALPSVGGLPLLIETDDDKFLIFSFGLGVAWTNAAQKNRTFDFAFDFGGDAPGFALSWAMEL